MRLTRLNLRITEVLDSQSKRARRLGARDKTDETVDRMRSYLDDADPFIEPNPVEVLPLRGRDPPFEKPIGALRDVERLLLGSGVHAIAEGGMKELVRVVDHRGSEALAGPQRDFGPSVFCFLGLDREESSASLFRNGDDWIGPMRARNQPGNREEEEVPRDSGRSSRGLTGVHEGPSPAGAQFQDM